MIELDKIYNEDCLVGMKNIPDGTIDAVICDLPYGTTACAWDSVIPFDKLWEQYNRIVKNDGAIVLFGAEPFSSSLRMSNIKNFKYDWIWHKSCASNFLVADKRPLNDYEIISVFYRKFGTYNPQPRKLEPETIARAKRTKTKQWRSGGIYGEQELYRVFGSTGEYGKPKAVIKFNNRENNQFHKEMWHPTQKPVDLLRYLVLTYTNEGDTVLDNCSGSGTTAVACVKEKRHFICFEKDEIYWKKSVERIWNEQRQLKLF